MLIFREAQGGGSLYFDTIPEITMGFARFIAAMVMHVIVSEDLNNGLKMMKYAANHWWKFSNPHLAYLAGFLQVSSTIVIGLINYSVICISDDVLTLAKDFLALIVISQFDDFFAQATEIYTRNPEISVDVVSEAAYIDLVRIEVTTSTNAKYTGRVKLPRDPIHEKVNTRRTTRYQELGEQKEALYRPQTIFIDFWHDRPLYSKVEFVIYRIFRWLYVSVWFYFGPFIVLLIMYLTPIIKEHFRNIEDEASTLDSAVDWVQAVWGGKK